MAAPSQPRRIYHVFLSFRGSDTRHTIVSHIYKALEQSGIYTFIDSEKLQQGEQVSPALIEAIEGSRVAVIVFSLDFASSWWCLDEVARIMERKAAKEIIVLPVFYYVDPKEVRGGRNAYKIAWDNHEVKYGKDSTDVKRWKKALEDAGSLYGSELNVWTVAENTPIQLESREFKAKAVFRKGTSIKTGGKFQNEAELVESIVREIWIQLNPRPLDVAQFQVGIDSRVNELIVNFNLKSKEDTRELVLWSMGGMGKTTLARALYNSIFKDFEGSAYVDGIKGTLHERDEMVHLQKKLLSQILMIKEISLNSDAEGSSLIAERLSRKRVLLTLDGVDNVCQIDCLARARDWFGKGSKIIITTTNKVVLNRIGVSRHTVQPLKNAEACELFMKYASVNGYKIIKGDLIRRVLRCTRGLPLALKVLGNDFAASEENEWEGRLDKFARSSSKLIDDVLRISYDGLDKDEQQIFLHIACFFNGWSRRYVEAVLKKCGLPGDAGVNNLIRRSLIMDENGILKVHDLIELMGKNIVDGECDDAAQRSRLWRQKDVDKVLSGDEGTDAYLVKAIVLAPPKPEKIKIRSGAFAKLRNLRFLIMINVEADIRDPICLPRELRWFEWPEYPSSSLKLTSPDNLAVLAVRKHLFKEPEEP